MLQIMVCEAGPFCDENCYICVGRNDNGYQEISYDDLKKFMAEWRFERIETSPAWIIEWNGRAIINEHQIPARDRNRKFIIVPDSQGFSGKGE